VFFAASWRRFWSLRLARNTLLDPLVGPGVVEVLHVLLHHSGQMTFAQEVIEALSPQAAQEALANGVRLWRSIWRFQYLDL